MAKSKRGHALWNLPSRGRGTCPICQNTRIKLLYPKKKTDGAVVKVCKRCDKAPQTKVDAVLI
ncbi:MULTISPECIES: hypothetical protein [Paenibacillus]|jgi:transcription elongation factor Elf1|uniref:Uncharacterized protein n=1 Tax=Paenibacillus odorifer TaxID=189426 RepID=A0A1R0XCI2_9BACL|nr:MULTISPECIES: hypothetical protein [Paenibacillus]AIQ74098.1 hypothetical protein PODO_13055 [Paenibacillus odorifer]AWV33429.1 hypothetical protein CD191_12820 [Paenibacillus odorifer]ETT49560.1 hypothetical protein C171_24855 [Paenibacillus sp. FSL H8-237]MDH6426974.1 transcription elongation factor Elf1 [Paenibacillus sp. PastH-4]MDH6443002.1 transcription elongation factor Elf1 [Paenibacillus sp. PastF-4]